MKIKKSFKEDKQKQIVSYYKAIQRFACCWKKEKQINLLMKWKMSYQVMISKEIT